jgi:hypothetical protein
MKKIILFLGFTLAVLHTYAQQKDVYMFCYFKDNGQDGLHLAYSNDGYKWQALKGDSTFLKPMVSNDRIMRDPCIIRGADSLFHMVWTDSWTDKGIGYASSKDLLTWSDQVQLPVMAKEPDAKNCWAPEITYDDATKTYMIYWATTITGRYAQPDTSAEGKKYNHRIYYVTTKDFKLYSETKPLYDPGFSTIDATIVKDGKSFIMFYKNETKLPVEKNLRTAFSTSLTGPYVDSGSPFTDRSYWAEGPTTLKIDGKWIVYFDKYTQHKYGALTSSDLKTWTDISDQITLPKGIRHGSVFKITADEFARLKQGI